MTDFTNAAVAARIIVETDIRRPLAYVQDYSATYYTSDLGAVELPYRPLRVLTSIVRANDGSAITEYALDRFRITDLPLFTWVTPTYDHGWHDEEIPEAIQLVIARLTERLTQNDAGIVREGIGGRTGYTVDYGPAFNELSAAERRLLTPYRCGPSAVAVSSNTREPRPSDWPSLSVRSE